VQSCPVPPVQQDHLDWLRHARQPGPRRRSLLAALHLPL